MSSVKQGLDKEQLQSKLEMLVKEISDDLSQLESEQSKELLGDFVSELYFAAADQRRREERRQKQSEGIAAAKERGVRFGRSAKPVPDNFDQFHRAWREGKMTMSQAAEACGLTRGTFYRIATRQEQTDVCAV